MNDSETLAEVMHGVFPERPKKPLRPTVEAPELQGIYHNAGYGNITLRLKDDPNSRCKRKRLSASRLEYTFPMVLDLYHASGDWWLIVLDAADNPIVYFRSYAKAEFQFGVDDKPNALEVYFLSGDPKGESEDTKVVFEKIG
ncbi:hypothetical protein JDV02_002923 [Purpureocillium takamizusanense]|uniref:Peptidase S12 Pab87-related C-terminal domain-containing protein n=1 Tax=Purpureocillium takamizusanense TaxID=2060973 RepID=A0A9Q8QCY0_9HYPO|nr:uncharacterized protein JDV02_002923 [Purpureocillium takamizusanense]UNI16492.1 hypothetical protein JDV02_002923 [Purpureocillium takamizusanense]